MKKMFTRRSSNKKKGDEKKMKSEQQIKDRIQTIKDKLKELMQFSRWDVEQQMNALSLEAHALEWILKDE